MSNSDQPQNQMRVLVHRLPFAAHEFARHSIKLSQLAIPRGNARLGKNLRVHHHDVGHGEEGGESAKKLAADGRVVFGETEVALDQWDSILEVSVIL